MTLLAIDVGGTKTAVAHVSPQGHILAKTQAPTTLEGPAANVAQIAALAAQLAPAGPITAIGAAVPAALAGPETDRVIWAPNLPGWRDFALREALQEALHAPACLTFDGHAAALGEWWAGVAQGCASLASIIIGTGIGGGFVADGQIWPGYNRLAGAVGWMPLPGPAGLDHWENLAAGPAIAQRAQTLLAAGHSSTLDPADLSAKTVCTAARQGDDLALAVMEETAVIIGLGLASVINLVNPAIVVLGGSVGQQGDLLLPTVQATVRRWAQPIAAQAVPIVSSTLGEEADLLGAAYAALTRCTARP